MGEQFYLPDYDNSILSLSCSILKHFGVTPKHKTLRDADLILSKNYKHVVVILLDGLGMNIMKKHLSKKDFLRKHFIKEYSSVFPSSTTASTTSFLSGLSPIEHGWLGWDVYFEQEDKTVTCFTNNYQASKTKAANYDIANKYFPYKNIAQQINETNNAEARILYPFGPKGFPKMGKMMDEISKICSSDKSTFTYAYWANPDHQLHIDGTNSEKVHKAIAKMNEEIENLCGKLKDTVVFVTADHGHTDVQKDYLVENHMDFVDMLVRPYVLEPRAISFYVKDEYKNTFSTDFNYRFGNDYLLFTKEEIFENHLFGFGSPNKNLTGIGDFIACAKNNKMLLWNKAEPNFKSHHAGLTKREMRIPLICFESK